MSDEEELHNKVADKLNSREQPEWITKAYDDMRHCKCGQSNVMYCKEWDEETIVRKQEGTDHEIVEAVCSKCGTKEFDGYQIHLPEEVDKLPVHVLVRNFYQGNIENIKKKLECVCYCPDHCPKHKWESDYDTDEYCSVCGIQYTRYLELLLIKNKIEFQKA